MASSSASFENSFIKSSDLNDAAISELIESSVVKIEDGIVVTGKVVAVSGDEISLDIGYKSEGIIPQREFSIRRNANLAEEVKLGDELEAIVLQKEDRDGRLLLSCRRASFEKAWNDLYVKFEAGEVLHGEVIELVRGGLIVDIGLRGFLPSSLVDIRRLRSLESYIGETVDARIIEMDKERKNVVLSRKVLLEESRKSERSEILGKLAKGMRLKGTVSTVVDFGVFVDLGGMDGLVHISELSWDHIAHPSEVVKVGDEIEVEVLGVDPAHDRISLGIKQTTSDPWREKMQAYPIGTVANAVVKKMVDFGVFAEIEPGIEGLVHISEMSNKRVKNPNQVVKLTDEVQVKIINIDFERRRLALSMQAVAEEQGFEIPVAEEDVTTEDFADDKPLRVKADEAPAEATFAESKSVAETPVEEAPAEEKKPAKKTAAKATPAKKKETAVKAATATKVASAKTKAKKAPAAKAAPAKKTATKKATTAKAKAADESNA